ncbi:MAG: hypothetical protein AAF063_27300 [Cyanobacteria bacterium J06643_5]
MFLVLAKPPLSPNNGETSNYLSPPELGVGGQNHTCNQQRRFFYCSCSKECDIDMEKSYEGFDIERVSEETGLPIIQLPD